LCENNTKYQNSEEACFQESIRGFFRYKFIFSATSLRRIIFSQVILMKLKIMKKKYFSVNYFLKELNGNLTQIKPAKTNQLNVEHKVVLILSFQLISNIFHILLQIFLRAAI
jgi:hypothetical protein